MNPYLCHLGELEICASGNEKNGCKIKAAVVKIIHFNLFYISYFMFQNFEPVKLRYILNLHLLNTTCPVLANSVDPDQLAPEEAK